MRYLTDAERRDFADIIKTYIKKMWSTAETPGHHHRKISFKPFMLTKENINLLVSRGLKDSVLPDYWGSVSQKEDFVVCRSKTNGYPIHFTTRVPAYAGVMLGIPGGHAEIIARYDSVPAMSRDGKYGPTHFSWGIWQALAAVYILENLGSSKVPSRMMIEMKDEDSYNRLLSVLEMPVRYLSVSIKHGAIARLDDPETLEPPFHGHFDRKHQHLLDDLIHSEALSGGSLVFDAVEITRAKWIKKERFADMFNVFGARDLLSATNMVVAWEFDSEIMPPGRIALETFEELTRKSKIFIHDDSPTLSDFEAVLEGDRVVDPNVLFRMFGLSREHFLNFYNTRSYMAEFSYDNIVDPR